ncbi:hypothetical protein DB313_04765 (plasmid) [Borrelia turcica IST7]|uniref:Protein BptA n=1 Tax=Borrelia turcica IST7 TaxID=1104446 RepID=A0A386PMK7_9SPIR|nr:hypothetical protein [Borrelia turcica]AYE36814.1 hypothetical protein DB313_04765 [Borrelia turcica IST7]
MRFVSIIFRMLLLCASSLSLLSAGVLESCGEYVCSKTYEQKFGDDSRIRSVLFQREILKKDSEGYLSSEESYRKALDESFPYYHFKFTILGEKRMLNFKNVIFDGVEAEMSMFDITEPSVQLARIKDFHIEPVENNKKLLGLLFPVEVRNNLVVYLRREFVDKLKQKDKLKITLIAHDDSEYVVEMSNILKEYDF